MTPPLGESIWIFHAGALGDHVLIWPLVRSLARQGTRVTVVAAESHARLCEREVGESVHGEGPGLVIGIASESARYTGLWAGRTPTGPEVIRGVSTVVTFIADDHADAGRTWIKSAGLMFPGARIMCVGQPGSASRASLWAEARADEFGGVSPAPRGGRDIVLFAGAGGAAKRWPVERWRGLAERLGDERVGDLAPIGLYAGPVEAEKFSASERAAFQAAGGRFFDPPDDLGYLARWLRHMGLFVGADTGPTHLAAQLGVPTLALFGPTDPRIWKPVGPRVQVLAPPTPQPMTWLSVERVADAIREML